MQIMGFELLKFWSIGDLSGASTQSLIQAPKASFY